MPKTRSSIRPANDSDQGPATDKAVENGATLGSKRKSEDPAIPKPKRGRPPKKQQATIEETLPSREKDATEVDEMEQGTEVIAEQKDTTDSKPQAKELGEEVQRGKTDEKADEEDKMEVELTKPKGDETVSEKKNGHSSANDAKPENGTNDKTEDYKLQEKVDSKPEVAQTQGNAVEQSSEREASTPSSVLEKGIIYFFFRGRVGIDDPSDVQDIARSYIVLRPLPHGAKLGNGPIGDDGNCRLLALPKKVLPVSIQDKFMLFVERAKSTTQQIKDSLTASDYATKTAGTRHTPAAAPIGEGIYAITTTGRESHLAYILTIPSAISEVQRDMGLQDRGSFVASVKNPQYEGPANATLPKGPEFPKDILDEFRSLRWMPLQPKHLEYENVQFLLIGSGTNDLSKVSEDEPKGGKGAEDTALEEMEKLEHEDEIRVAHRQGDDSIFEDLGLSRKEYPKIQTTW